MHPLSSSPIHSSVHRHHLWRCLSSPGATAPHPSYHLPVTCKPNMFTRPTRSIHPIYLRERVVVYDVNGRSCHRCIFLSDSIQERLQPTRRTLHVWVQEGEHGGAGDGSSSQTGADQTLASPQTQNPHLGVEAEVFHEVLVQRLLEISCIKGTHYYSARGPSCDSDDDRGMSTLLACKSASCIRNNFSSSLERSIGLPRISWLYACSCFALRL